MFLREISLVVWKSSEYSVNKTPKPKSQSSLPVFSLKMPPGKTGSPDYALLEILANWVEIPVPVKFYLC